MRVLLTGWASFLHGEATAGDVLSLRAVAAALTGAGVDHEIAWSPRFRPDALHLDDAAPGAFTHVVFACGPVHGTQLRELHRRYAACRRIAVGVSVPDPADPAVTGFHLVLPREADLSLAAAIRPASVLGVVPAPHQPEYGDRGRHEEVHAILGKWLAALDCARVPLDTRLDHDDWTHCATPDQFAAVVSKMDAVVTTRLHGLVFARRAGVPVLAIDPVSGGDKVQAQAEVLGWPAVLTPERVSASSLDHWLSWCLSSGRRRAEAPLPAPDAVRELVEALR